MTVPLRAVLLDQYDSFTWNLRDLLIRAALAQGLDLRLDVLRPHQTDLGHLQRAGYDAAVLSPGPNAPQDAPLACELVQAWQRNRPIFGVCLGLQVIAHALGGRVVRAPRPVHGMVDRVQHDGQGCLVGLANEIEVMRYHSLVVDAATLPPALRVTATLVGAANLPMAALAPTLGLEGVQFHPESVATPDGLHMARNVVQQWKSWLGGDVARGVAHADTTA